MKLIRKPPPIEVPKVEVPKAEPQIAQPGNSEIAIEMLAAMAQSTNRMLTHVAKSTEAVADKLQEIKPAQPEAKPTAFHCRVTSRDHLGRVEAFEITALPDKGQQ